MANERTPLLQPVFESDDEEEDVAPTRSWSSLFASRTVPNIGSAARDYCALERTYLSHVRLGLVLLALSSSLIFKARFPRTDGTTAPPDHATNLAAVPLGSIYAACALIALSGGFAWYDHGLKGLLTGKGFLDGDLPIHEYAMGFIALVIFATALLLLIDNRNDI